MEVKRNQIRRNMKNYIIIFLLLLAGCSRFTDRPKTDISQEQLIGKVYLNSKTDSIPLRSA